MSEDTWLEERHAELRAGNWRGVMLAAQFVKPRAVLGFNGPTRVDLGAEILAESDGAEFVRPWVRVLRMPDGRCALVRCSADETLGNGGGDTLEEALTYGGTRVTYDDVMRSGWRVDVEVAASWPDLWRWGLTTEERERLAAWEPKP